MAHYVKHQEINALLKTISTIKTTQNVQEKQFHEPNATMAIGNRFPRYFRLVKQECSFKPWTSNSLADKEVRFN